MDAHSRAAPVACGVWWITLWAIVWCGAAWLTSFWPSRLELALPFERTVPQQTWMIPVYASYDAIAPLLPFFCRGWRDYALIGGAILAQTMVACSIYIIIPQQLAFSTTQSGAVWDWMSAHTGLPHPGLYSYAPSMHVAGAVAIGLFFTARTSGALRWLLWGWCGAVIASTWMVHEHHLADIASGVLLALVVQPRSTASDPVLSRTAV